MKLDEEGFIVVIGVYIEGVLVFVMLVVVYYFFVVVGELC